MDITCIENCVDEILKIRYIKLQFFLTFTEDTIMPLDKVSAFRGGIGEMLLRANCIRNRKCDVCDFESECIVRRIMYSKSLITPISVSEGESMGYIFECEDLKEEFLEGDELRLNLILFGKNIVYFSQYLNAISLLGMEGIGRNKSKFFISEILNTHNESLLVNGNILMANYHIETIKDYVDYRISKISELDNLEIKMSSTVSLKYRGNLLTAFDLDAFYEAVVRRVYMLDCYEGIEMNQQDYRFDNLPFELLEAKSVPVTIKRYSNNKNQHMYLNGIKGYMKLKGSENASKEEKMVVLKLVLAGEILHVGKSTSFGFGRYIVR